MPLVSRPKPKTYHRKRQAQHHRRSKRYLKAYWPYLPMLVIIGAGVFVSSLLSSSSQVLGSQVNFSPATLLSATNDDRLQNGDDPLRLNSQLDSAAQAKAADMASNNYWAHVSPSGKTPWDFIDNSGYQFTAAGENLAYGFNSAAAVINAWMNSPEHRANLLYPQYQDVGFGVIEAANYVGHGPKVIVVAEYGDPLVAGTAPSQSNPTNFNYSSSQPVSRLQLLTGFKPSWATLAIAAVAGAAMASLVIRYSIKLRRLVLEGESFIIHHPMFDIGLTLLITACVVLTRTVGLIS